MDKNKLMLAIDALSLIIDDDDVISLQADKFSGKLAVTVFMYRNNAGLTADSEKTSDGRLFRLCANVAPGCQVYWFENEDDRKRKEEEASELSDEASAD